MKEICTFYENLYQSKQIKNNEINSYLSELELDRKLNEKEKSFRDEIITLRECEEAVLNLKDNKSPGIDGIPSEFYKTFWNEIKNILYSCLLYTFETGKMSLTQRL